MMGTGMVGSGGSEADMRLTFWLVGLISAPKLPPRSRALFRVLPKSESLLLTMLRNVLLACCIALGLLEAEVLVSRFRPLLCCCVSLLEVRSSEDERCLIDASASSEFCFVKLSISPTIISPRGVEGELELLSETGTLPESESGSGTSPRDEVRTESLLEIEIANEGGEVSPFTLADLWRR